MKEILKFLKDTSKKEHPKDRGIYVILGGTYSGEYFIYIKSKPDTYTFFSLPIKAVRDVPIESFKTGIKNKLVDFVEQLPYKVYKTVELEYNSINNKNGLSESNKNNEPDKWPTSCS